MQDAEDQMLSACFTAFRNSNLFHCT